VDRLWNSDLVSIWSDQAGWAALNQPAEIADLPSCVCGTEIGSVSIRSMVLSTRCYHMRNTKQ